MHNQELMKIIHRRREAGRPIVSRQVLLEDTPDSDPDNPESCAIDVWFEDMSDCETAMYVSKLEAEEDLAEVQAMLPIIGTDMLNPMWTKEEIEYKAAPYGKVCRIPAFTPVIPAVNLPDGGYWVLPWDNMSESALGWMGGYGIHLNPDEVEPIPRCRPEKMLDISTGHLTERDRRMLYNMDMDLRAERMNPNRRPLPFRVYETHYGYIVYTGHVLLEVMEECENQNYEFSPGFWKQYAYAKHVGATLINYDMDAEQYEDFEYHE